MASRILPHPWIAVSAFIFSHLVALGAEFFVSNVTTNTIDRIDATGRHSIFASGLNQPRGLVFDHSGLLYAANADANEILTFAPDGTRSVFATNFLTGPRGLAFDQSGSLFATNGGSVVKFSLSGEASLFAAGGNLSSPRGLAFDNDGNLFVANSGNNTLLQFAPDGTRLVLSSPLLNVPYGLVFDSSGVLYVSNFNGDSILRRNADGTFSNFITTQLDAPYGMKPERFS